MSSGKKWRKRDKKRVGRKDRKKNPIIRYNRIRFKKQRELEDEINQIID